MSCNAIQLRTSEILNSTFRSRVFELTIPDDNRNPANDIFTAKVKIKGTEILEIPGNIVGNRVIFQLTELEDTNKFTDYEIDYWANLDALGKELFAQEDLRVASKVQPDRCTPGVVAGTLNFGDVVVQAQVTMPVKIIQHGSLFDGINILVRDQHENYSDLIVSAIAENETNQFKVLSPADMNFYTNPELLNIVVRAMNRLTIDVNNSEKIQAYDPHLILEYYTKVKRKNSNNIIKYKKWVRPKASGQSYPFFENFKNDINPIPISGELIASANQVSENNGYQSTVRLHKEIPMINFFMSLRSLRGGEIIANDFARYFTGNRKIRFTTILFNYGTWCMHIPFRLRILINKDGEYIVSDPLAYFKVFFRKNRDTVSGRTFNMSLKI